MHLVGHGHGRGRDVILAALFVLGVILMGAGGLNLGHPRFDPWKFGWALVVLVLGHGIIAALL